MAARSFVVLNKGMDWDGRFGLAPHPQGRRSQSFRTGRKAYGGSSSSPRAAAPTFSSVMRGRATTDRRLDYDDGSIPRNVRSVFTRFDRNRSGRLDYRELRNALRALGLDVTTGEAASVLAAYDYDDSGLMEIDEFARLCRQLGHVERQLMSPGPRGTVVGEWETDLGSQLVGYEQVPVYERRVEVEKEVEKVVEVPYEVEVPVPYEVPTYYEVPVYLERQVRPMQKPMQKLSPAPLASTPQTIHCPHPCDHTSPHPPSPAIPRVRAPRLHPSSPGFR